MENVFQVNDEITIGPQPSEDDIRQLSSQFKTVVNFRTAGEDEASLSPQVEGDAVRALGMYYLHVPVVMKSMEPERVDEFRAKYSELPKPIFAHCKSGKRAGAMAVMNLGIQQGLNGEQALSEADRMGLDFDKPELRGFIKDYVDRHAIGP